MKERRREEGNWVLKSARLDGKFRLVRRDYTEKSRAQWNLIVSERRTAVVLIGFQGERLWPAFAPAL